MPISTTRFARYLLSKWREQGNSCLSEAIWLPTKQQVCPRGAASGRTESVNSVLWKCCPYRLSAYNFGEVTNKQPRFSVDVLHIRNGLQISAYCQHSRLNHPFYGFEWAKTGQPDTTDLLCELSAKIMRRTGSEYFTIDSSFDSSKGVLQRCNCKCRNRWQKLAGISKSI